MTRRSIAAAAFVAVVAGMVSAQTARERFAFERPATIAAPGPQRLRVDAALLSGGAPFRVVSRGGAPLAEGGLSDLRFFDRDGRPVDYLLVHPPPSEPAWASGVPLHVAETKTASGFEADFGSARSIDRIRVEGIPAPFLKRLTLEGSGDRTRWTMLAEQGTLFDLPAEGLRQLELGFAPGSYRYVRVTWDDTNSGRMPMPGAVLARQASAAQTLPQPLHEVPFEPRPSSPGASRYRIRLPASRLPVVALDLDVASGHVFRRATVFESRFAGTEASPVDLGSATLTRVVREGVEAAALRVPIAPPEEAELDLVIEDGQNQPLEVRRVSLVFAELPWIYFEPAGPLTARYGNRTLARPAFDLEAVRASVDVTKLPDASWGEPRPLMAAEAHPASQSLQPGGVIDRAAFRHRRPIPSRPPGLVALPLDAGVLAHSGGPGLRFEDVRVLDGAGRQIPYLIERRDEPLTLDVPFTPTGAPDTGASPAPGRQQSSYRLTLPYANLTSGTLVLQTSARVFQRSVRVGVDRPPDRRHREEWLDVRASGSWKHVDEETSAAPLMLRLDASQDRELRLIVDEGDNAPLPITSARLLLPSYRLRFHHPGEGPLELAYGRSDLRPPQYDLALLAQHVMGAVATEAVAETEQPGIPAADTAFISRRTFWLLLVTAVVALLLLIARLLRGGGNEAAGA
ncbi:MAG TPA: DUF3999 family protein [Vicinamibacterales bacterium]|nr:DUF3999 family protein [Vicinamibacterales bacterium]